VIPKNNQTTSNTTNGMNPLIRLLLFGKGGGVMRNKGTVCTKKEKKKAPIVVITFGGALLCFCFVSPMVLVCTLGVALIVLGIWLLKSN
jgi:hypothetical protein